MQTYKNELTVTRGETFTIDKLLQNKDGSPYIVSNKLNNPFWLLSISNTVYSQENRYVKNYWLPVSSPKFNSTNAVNIKDIKVSNDVNAMSKYNSIHDVISFPIVGYYNNSYVSFDDGTDSVFYEFDENGNATYLYWDDENNQWIEYECRIIKTFLQNDTKDWLSQNYQYSIQLVSGILVREYLENVAEDFGIAFDENMSDYELYNMLLNLKVKFPKDFDVEQALGSIDTMYPILEATKIKVLDNTQGEIV